jgi:hypothetical protein
MDLFVFLARVLVEDLTGCERIDLGVTLLSCQAENRPTDFTVLILLRGASGRFFVQVPNFLRRYVREDARSELRLQLVHADRKAKREGFSPDQRTYCVRIDHSQNGT